MSGCCSVPVLQESKQNLPAMQLGEKKQALNNASLSEAQLNAIKLRTIVAGSELTRELRGW